MSRPPLELTIEALAADGSGRFSFAPMMPQPGMRPDSISFRTARFQGFGDGTVVLPRLIDRDYADLQLLDEWTLTGADGTTAYEGRLRNPARDFADDGHRITVGLAGWISHLQDRRFSMLFVDRDPSVWQGVSAARRNALAATVNPLNDVQVVNDDGGTQALMFDASGHLPGSAGARAEAWTRAPDGCLIAGLIWGSSRVVNGANLTLGAYGADDSSANGLVGPAGSVTNAATLAVAYHAFGASKRWATLAYSYPGPAYTSDENQRFRYAEGVGIVGNHGLSLVTNGAGMLGVLASDVLTWLIANYCPKLNPDGIQATSLPLTNLAFRDRTYVTDAIPVINQPHGYEYGVWDNRSVVFEPSADLTDYDWEVRLTDPGVRVTLQGDVSDQLVSGLEVQYTDVATGEQRTLMPADYAELRDDSIENPFNRAGYPGEDTIQIGTTDIDTALETGRIALANRNAPRTPGTITVGPYVRDRSGKWQPSWKVRATQRVALTDHQNARPRLIGETEYTHDSRGLSIALDSTLPTPDSILADLQSR